MSRLKNMIGFKTGKLTVTAYSHVGRVRSKNVNFWNAICECGNNRVISTGELNRKRTLVPSCGCYHYFKDLSGKKFNDLTVLKLNHKNKSQYYWLCKCNCGNEKVIRGESLTRKIVKTCGCLTNPNQSIYIDRTKQRLLSNIEINSNGCWNWEGFIAPSGYGKITAIRLGVQSTHRLSWLIHKGKIPDGRWVLHTCDNKKCCNPDHLYLGTVKENVKDAMERGQFPKGPNKKKGFIGSKHPLTELNEDKVRYIKFLCKNNFNRSEICSFFGVKKHVIGQIARNKTWKHVN